MGIRFRTLVEGTLEQSSNFVVLVGARSSTDRHVVEPRDAVGDEAPTPLGDRWLRDAELLGDLLGRLSLRSK